MIDLGTIRPGSTIRIPFSTFDKAKSAALLSNRLSQCPMDTPTVPEPHGNRHERDSCFLTPFDKRLCLAVESQQTIVALVPVLLLSSCPPDVTRFVVSSPVRKPVELVLRRWARTHIRQEVFKTVFPALANRYASAAIPSVISRLGIVTAMFHRHPNSVDGGSLISMPPFVLGCPLSSHASTTVADGDVLAGEGAGKALTLFPTSTLAKPLSAPDVGFYGKESDLFSYQTLDVVMQPAGHRGDSYCDNSSPHCNRINGGCL